jgi:hypothetical protein
MVTAHRGKFIGSQVIKRQVNRTSPTVARLGGYISFFKHLDSVNIRIVSWLRPAILRLFRPAQEAIYGTLRAVAVPEKQAEAKGRGLFSCSFQGGAQCPRADNSICHISVHRFAGEVVPGGVLGIPAYSGYDLVRKDKIIFHRPFPVNVNDTIRSITSPSGSPAAAIILG